jgi:hypothetical protein
MAGSTAISPSTRRRPTRVTDVELEEFLARLREGFPASVAAGLGGHCRETFYKVARRDRAFRTAWQQAYQAGTEVLVDELRRRCEERWDLDPRTGVRVPRGVNVSTGILVRELQLRLSRLRIEEWLATHERGREGLGS